MRERPCARADGITVPDIGAKDTVAPDAAPIPIRLTPPRKPRRLIRTGALSWVWLC